MVELCQRHGDQVIQDNGGGTHHQPLKFLDHLWVQWLDFSLQILDHLSGKSVKIANLVVKKKNVNSSESITKNCDHLRGKAVDPSNLGNSTTWFVAVDVLQLGTGHIYADHLGIPDFLQGHAWSHSHISLVLFFLVTWQRFRKTAEKMWDTQNWCLPVDDWNPASKTGGATVDAWKFLQHLGVVNCRCRLPNWSDINGSNYECKQACHA